MNLKTEFTEPECAFFRQQCNFTGEEREIFDMRVKGHHLVEIQQKLCITESTLNRRIKNIKKKIYKVM